MNLLWNSFEDSNEKNWWQQKDEVLEWNIGKCRLRGGVCENPVGLPMYGGSQNGTENQTKTR